jgi:hypothetical protein
MKKMVRKTHPTVLTMGDVTYDNIIVGTSV